MTRNPLTSPDSKSFPKSSAVHSFRSIVTTAHYVQYPPDTNEPDVLPYNDARTPTADANQTATDTDASPYFNTVFNPSMAIIIVVLLIVFLAMAGLLVYVTARRAGNGASTRRRRTRTYQSVAEGLDKSHVDKLPVVRYTVSKSLKEGKDVQECVVCLTEFQENETLRLLPKCGHLFHKECVDMWLYSHTTCPLCRTDLVAGEGVSVHELVDAESEIANTEDREAILDNDGNYVYPPDQGNSFFGGEITITIPDNEASLYEERSSEPGTEKETNTSNRLEQITDSGPATGETTLQWRSPVYGIIVESPSGRSRN